VGKLGAVPDVGKKLKPDTTSVPLIWVEPAIGPALSSWLKYKRKKLNSWFM
jgi:hypothetical protein